MLKKIFVMLVLVTMAFASSGLVSAQLISEHEAEKIASQYAYEGEHAESPRILVYHDDKPYHVIEFIKDGTYKGLLIINATSGGVVKDEDTVKDICYAVEITEDITPEVLSEDLASIKESQLAVIEMEVAAKELRELAKDPELSSESKRSCRNLASSFETMGKDFSRLASIENESYNIEKQLFEKKDTKLAKDLISKNDELILYADTLVSSLRVMVEEYATFCDAMISETINETEKIYLEAEKQAILAEFTGSQQELDLVKTQWESEKSEIDKDVTWNVEKMNNRITSFEATPIPTATPTPTPSPTPTPTPEEKGVPGFEAVFAIAGLLVITYLLRRRG